MYSYSKFVHDNYKKSSFKHKEPISKDFKVKLNGEEIPVYTCRISKIPFNRPWPGYQRGIDQTELVSFVNIVSDEEINLEVEILSDYENVMIRPYSKGITYTDDGGKISFKLKENGQFVFSCDDLHGCLYIFNSKPIAAPSHDEVTHYFGPGIHTPGKITLHDNESIYVDKDALVFGYIYAENAQNIRVFGNGLFDGSGEDRIDINCYEEFTNGNIKFYDCRSVNVEGVLFRDSAIWCINIFHCFNVTVDNVKVFGQWRYNTDGVDIVNSQNITVKNSFIHSFDDTVTIKGIDRYITTDNENITTDNCVMWCDWGKTCEVGLETACRYYKNIVFRNCDIIRAGNTAFDIQNGDCAEVFDVTFENMNVEYNSFDNVPVLQESEEQAYDKYGEIFVPHLISFVNNRFRGDAYCNDIWGIPKDTAPIDLTGVKYAAFHDIAVKNINVYYDEKIPKKDEKYDVPIDISSFIDDVTHYNISVSDIKINGEKVTENDLPVSVSHTENFSFE